MTNLWSKILYAGENKAVPDNIVLHRAWGTAITIHDQFDSVLLKGIGIATIGLVDTGLMGGGPGTFLPPAALWPLEYV